MALDKATVARIGHLARIRLDDPSLDTMVAELNTILTFVEALDGVDTEGVPPMTGVVQMDLRRRADVVDDGAMPDRVLANAPEEQAGFYTVPKVVE